MFKKLISLFLSVLFVIGFSTMVDITAVASAPPKLNVETAPGKYECTYKAKPVRITGFHHRPSTPYYVVWSKSTDNITGYQIRYSTSAKFSSPYKTTAGPKARSKMIKGLKPYQTYYIQVRTYKTHKHGKKNVTHYSKWSKTYTVKT